MWLFDLIVLFQKQRRFFCAPIIAISLFVLCSYASVYGLPVYSTYTLVYTCVRRPNVTPQNGKCDILRLIKKLCATF